MRSSSRQGFTLIEMLVVLVLTSLVVGLVFEGLGRVADLRVRLARHLDGALDETIVGAWFRGSITGLLPDQSNAPDAFKGSAIEMSGLTLKPLDLPPGAATSFGWRLQSDAAAAVTRLFYRGPDGQWREIAAWAASGARFLYAGPDGQWRSDWPPPFDAPTASGGAFGMIASREKPQLPRFVRLDGGSGSGARQIAASVLGTTMPRQGLADILRAIQ